MNKLRAAAMLAAALLAAPLAAWGAGMWSTLPVVGGSSYCAAIVGAAASQAGQTGQGAGSPGSNGTYCAQTVPGGPATFSGNEVAPVDLNAPGSVSGVSPTTALVSVLQLGQGPVVDNNVAGAAQTIPNGTSFFVLDTNTPATVAVTFPAVAVEGQEVHLVCGIAIATALSVVANSGQTVKGAAPATCTAGAGFAWRFVAQVNGALVANTWLRIQ